jgi:hypothetical protein
VRTLVTTALLVALAGCGSSAGESSQVDRCVDRLLARADATDTARLYARNAYCEPFASRGWVYEDGALSIDAQHWLVEGGSEECESAANNDGQSETVPCEQSSVIDCALLQHVRRSEAQDYLATLGRDVECDDGTPVEQLGVP